MNKVISSILMLFLLSLSLLFMPIASHATTIHSPVAVINNTLGISGPSFLTDYMIDQSGLSSGFTSGVTDFALYLSGSPTHDESLAGEGWRSPDGTTTGILDFDMGVAINIGRMVIWADDYRAPDDITVLASNDPSFTSSSVVAYLSIADPANNVPIVPQIFDLSVTNTRYIRFDITSSHDTVVTSIGEVAFENGLVAPIPEPATMLLFGFGLLGLAGVGRRKK